MLPKVKNTVEVRSVMSSAHEDTSEKRLVYSGTVGTSYGTMTSQSE